LGVLEKIAQVVGLPSPRPLHEQIQGMRPAQLDPLVTRLSSTTGRIGDQVAALDEGYYQRVSASWQGDGAQAFQEHYANLTNAVGRPQAAMAGAATTLNTLQQSLQDVQKQEKAARDRTIRAIALPCLFIPMALAEIAIFGSLAPWLRVALLVLAAGIVAIIFVIMSAHQSDMEALDATRKGILSDGHQALSAHLSGLTA
jgi:uncharacterized protein YukE